MPLTYRVTQSPLVRIWRAALEWVASASSSSEGAKSDAKKIAVQRAQRMARATLRRGLARPGVETECVPENSGRGAALRGVAEAKGV